MEKNSIIFLKKNTAEKHFMKHIKIVSKYFTINFLKYLYKETASVKKDYK